jgi:hypothetical protein
LYLHQLAEERKDCATQQQVMEIRARAEKRAHNQAFLAALLLSDADNLEMEVVSYGQDLRDSHRGLHSVTGKQNTPAWFRTPFENEGGIPATTVLRPDKAGKRAIVAHSYSCLTSKKNGKKGEQP